MFKTRKLGKRIDKASDGNIAMVMALMAPAFIGVVGLSVETGYWYFKQNGAQAASDTAAFAGAIALAKYEPTDVAIADAVREATLQGYGTSPATITANSPPVSGPYMNANSVEVIITYEPERYFSSLFNKSRIVHQTRGVASFLKGGDACILTLDPNASGALKIRGTTLIDAAGCHMMSNSDAADSVQITGDSDTTIDCIATAGGVDEQGNRFQMNMLECSEYRAPIAPLADPYEAVPEPVTNLVPCETVPSATSGTLDPGSDGVMRICGDLNLKGSWDFEPGVYIIDGGEFVADGGDVLTGDDVTFYFTNGGNVRWEGNSEVSFSAPSSGTYSGLLVFGDRADSNPVHRIAGTNQTNIEGAIYAADATVELTGTFDGITTCMQLVAGRVDLSGTSNISWSCPPGSGLNYAEVPDQVLLVE